VLEVERHISGEPMNTQTRLVHGLGVLAQIHNTLQELEADAALCEAPYANYVAPKNALRRTWEAAERVRRDGGSQAELSLVELAQKLALELRYAEPDTAARLPIQLVHGDFWDNNVLFRETQLVAVLDFDFMGERARIEDIALILCYVFTSPDFRQKCRPLERIGRLRELVDAYDASLRDPLSSKEREALPLALARNVLPPFCNLWHIRDAVVRRKYILQIASELEWALELLAEITTWQHGFA
jgi:homoserine kinase type II